MQTLDFPVGLHGGVTLQVRHIKHSDNDGPAIIGTAVAAAPLQGHTKVYERKVYWLLIEVYVYVYVDVN